MARLSKPIDEILEHYDVVVVGSGYGGAITASRLARAGRKVCLLERGKELQPGEYPDTLLRAGDEVQIDGPQGHLGSRSGLYEFHVSPDMAVFKGCGLGGTSLVNANVSLRAEPRVFDDPRWPEAVRADLETRVDEGYRRAEEMLQPRPYPDDYPRLPKMEAHRRSAEAMGKRWYPTPINVTFEDGINAAGVEQKACCLCGDCVTGCNHWAKNTTLMNYLPDAVNHGTEIFTEIDVRYLERTGHGWHVHYQPLATGRETFGAPTLFVSADVVVLGAGALGSTEILLRSREAGLALSERLGEHFTGNGDILGFGYNNDDRIDGVGFGHHDPAEMPPVGPCITSVIDQRECEELDDGMVLEEGSLPGSLAPILPTSFRAVAAMFGKSTRRGADKVLEHEGRVLESWFRGAREGAVAHTQTYLIMSHDDGKGRLELQNGRLRIDWPGVGKQRNAIAANADMEKAAESNGGTWVKNPIWNQLLGNEVITVHPLGGCCMAETAREGVVNHKHQVFAGPEGSDVHPGLYVNDGAVVPRPLGVNPLLTISALAERCCALIAEDHDWEISWQSRSKSRAGGETTGIGLQFTEKMAGFFAPGESADFETGYDRGKSDGSPLEFTLTITSHDLRAMLEESGHEARMVGTVVAPALSERPLTATRGVFNLFVDNPRIAGERNMVYRMRLDSEEGRSYFFHGYKVVPGTGSPTKAWHDTSTLYVTLHDGEDEAAPVLGKGILHIPMSAFLRQMSTLRVLGAHSLRERLDAEADFVGFFSGVMVGSYLPVFRRANELEPSPTARRRRALDAPDPELHPFQTDDGVELMLTRFHGGDRGPVIVAPGFGMPARSFAIDTVDTNLVEFLSAAGYDVFLFDYRASTDLPSAESQFTIDDVARRDWPAAVAKVRQITGADSAQVMGHCVGSMSYLMAQLAGLEGVRSAVCSQLTVHLVPPVLTKAKAQSHLATVLSKLGVDELTTDFHPSSWRERMFDRVMKLYPTHEECDSAVCRRILFQYGEVFRHDKINEATHRAIHEIFGPANLTTFRHMTRMMREGHSVAADGEESYLPHVERLRIPIAFLQGAENRMFLPEGSAKTYEWLCQHNGNELYRRDVFPTYGHLDCFIGRDAARDIFPTLLRELEAHA